MMGSFGRLILSGSNAEVAVFTRLVLSSGVGGSEAEAGMVVGWEGVGEVEIMGLVGTVGGVEGGTTIGAETQTLLSALRKSIKSIRCPVMLLLNRPGQLFSIIIRYKRNHLR